jgi:hypothetical protein
MVCNEVNCSTAEFRPFIVISSVSISLYGRVIVSFSFVNVSAERANPSLTVVKPTHERIDVSSTVLASYDWVVLK